MSSELTFEKFFHVSISCYSSYAKQALILNMCSAHAGLFWRQNTAVLQQYTAVLRQYRALLRQYMSFLRQYRAVLRKHALLLRINLHDGFTRVLLECCCTYTYTHTYTRTQTHLHDRFVHALLQRCCINTNVRRTYIAAVSMKVHLHIVHSYMNMKMCNDVYLYTYACTSIKRYINIRVKIYKYLHV